MSSTRLNVINSESTTLQINNTVSNDIVLASGGGSVTISNNLNLNGRTIIDQTDLEAFLVRKDGDTRDVFSVDTTNSLVKVGPSPVITNAGIFNISGTDATGSRPHVGFYSNIDIHPLSQLLNYNHDFVGYNMDLYYDGTWKSSDPGSNFQIVKNSDILKFNYGSGIAAGANAGAVLSQTAISISNAGSVTIPTLSSGIITGTGTTTSTSNTTGSLKLAGGLGISNTTDAVSSINGGTITTAGGLAVAKKAYIGSDLNVTGNLNVTGTITGISSSGIPETNFSASNNVVVPSNVTGLLFNESLIRSFHATVSITIIATTSVYANIELRGLQKSTGTWIMTTHDIGDNTGVQFTIVSSGGSGQVKYTSGNESGFVSSKFTFTSTTHNI